jgi:zinc protease
MGSKLILAALWGLLGLVALGTAWAGPKIETWETTKGARVLFAAEPDLPILDVRVLFDAGSARDGKRSGLASLTADMLEQGAGAWDADAIAERVESVGAQLSTGAARDSAFLAMRTLTEEPAMETALQTAVKVLANPRFAEDDFERVRKNRLVALRHDEQNPSTVGSKEVYRKIFGDHPYATDPMGTKDSLAALSRADLVEFYRRHYVASNAVVAIVGALTREQAQDVGKRLTDGLESGEPPPKLPPVPDLAEEVFEELNFPSSQTHVYAGQPGMKRLDPDYFPLYVGNHILGGSGLVSLLMEEVRERRGLSYSVYSYFLPMSERGPFLMGLQTKNDQATQAREAMLEILRRFREDGPTADELAAAVKNITGGFPLRIASNRAIVQHLAAIGFYGLPLDYLDRFNDRVSAVTAEQIRDAFSRRVHPNRLATVIVGPGADRSNRAK